MKSELIKCLFILVLGMLLGATVIARLFPNSRLHNTVCDAVVCDTTTVYDTIRVYKPVPRDSVVVRYVTQVVEVTRAEEQPTIAEESEQEPSITVEATSSDSVRVNVPITQKVYETEDYRAYVSGYQPSLDSLLFLRPTQVVRIREKPKRWGVGVQVGYGFTPQGAQPYIGVGISYNLFRF